MALSAVGSFASTSLNLACAHPKKTLFLGSLLALYLYSSDIADSIYSAAEDLADLSPELRRSFEELDLVTPLPTKWERARETAASIFCFVGGYFCPVEEASPTQSLKHTLSLYVFKAAALIFSGKCILNYLGLGNYRFTRLSINK